MVRLLLKSDASLANLIDDAGRTAFLIAASNGHIHVIKELLQLCPDCGEAVDGRGWNALHIAVERDNLEVVKYILESNELEELINEPNEEGNTPLLVSIVNRNIQILHLLLKDKRVDIKALNYKGETALDIAESDNELSMKFRKIVICTVLILAGAPRGHRQPNLQANRAHVKPREAPRIESYKATSKIILVVAGLIITVTFAGAFTIPGGYNSDGPDKGMATLTGEPAFWAFMITDSVALFSSISVALLLIWAGIGDQDLLVGTVSVATRLMAMALGSLTLAFLSGLWLVVSRRLCIVVLLISIGVFCLSFLSFSSQFSFLVLFFRWILSNSLFSHKAYDSKPQSSGSERGLNAQSSKQSRYNVAKVGRVLLYSQPGWRS